ncbi:MULTISPECIES: hypothetical protein [Streptomyces]|uniref:Uncharacterized protein n=1 Tax=Streptomyces kaempferi TaxID=333725 RepID=A0ABW3XUP3_9ACTN
MPAGIVLVGLPIDRAEAEESSEAEFELDGEVTGAGSGTRRCHRDQDIAAGSDATAALARLDACCPNRGSRSAPS